MITKWTVDTSELCALQLTDSITVVLRTMRKPCGLPLHLLSANIYWEVFESSETGQMSSWG